jgi:hypothetical protein
MTEPQGKADELPAPTFATFVLSLSTSALLQLGAIEDAKGTKAEPDLVLARHTIDILEVLMEKTRGNLDEEEEQLLSGVLHDLHLRFLEAQKR